MLCPVRRLAVRGHRRPTGRSSTGISQQAKRHWSPRIGKHAPEVKPKLLTLGLYPVGKYGADYRAFIHAQNDEYTRIIREANIKAE
jgi:hypothetical protein